jgi:ketosteroid isomerase-like protein
MRYRLVACLLIAISTLGAQANAQEAPSANEKDVATLRSAILRSAESFNKGDADAIMSQYARDIVLSYPGLPDLGYDTLVENYREMVKRPPGVTVHTSPTIEEILVSGDLALIRLMWTTTTTEASPPRQASRRMKDFQVWRRESDGTWKFARGMHFRIPEETPPSAEP